MDRGQWEPLHNPITGEGHRTRITLPNDFEYDICEVGSGTARTQGPIALATDALRAQRARLHTTESDVVH